MRFFEITAVFLLAMAWQYRKNMPLLFVIIATFFADAAMLSSRWENVSEWPVRMFSVCWLICMLGAGVLAAEKWIYILRKKARKS
jgi:hypothetical protein